MPINSNPVALPERSLMVILTQHIDNSNKIEKEFTNYCFNQEWKLSF